uniref:Uncharacterized protein n=1 Tax=Oryza punctata TaxID=4537 RepID=A0A0E0JZI8_ORYPU
MTRSTQLHTTFLSFSSQHPRRSSHHCVASAAYAAEPRLSKGAVVSKKTPSPSPFRKMSKVDDKNDLWRMNQAKFEPSIWGDFFLSYSNPLAYSNSQESMEERAEYLKKEVAKLIVNSRTDSLSEKLHLLDVLERLCLDHLFEEEIDAVLDEISNADVSDCELHTVALWFYLLRKHRHRVSPDVFLKFRDEDGIFEAEDARDLLSLYNAAHLMTHGERILDEAISFTKRQLRSLMPKVVEGSIAHDINCALEIPLPRRVRIYEAKYFMSTYEKGASVNEIIMELAMLSYNIMQIHHQQELKIITRWWKDLQLQTRLTFARDRVVECYFWIAGVYFEPCYSRGRIILTKVLAIVSILDDIYDVYGSPDECEQFTKCIESWDPKMGCYLPELLRFAFEKILDTYQNIDDELLLEEKYRMSYLKNFTIDLVRAYNKEVKWREEGYIPGTIDEHLQVSARSGMDDIASKDCFDWVCSVPKIVESLCIILRLSDDLKSYERERLTSHVASTIDSCMKEHNISIEMAREKIHLLIEESWKDFNGEWLDSGNNQPIQLMERIFNLTRTMEFFYKKDDAYTNGHTVKDNIYSLFVEPVMMT